MRKFIHAANAISVWVSNAALHCAPIGFYSISIFIRFILAIFGLPSLSSHLSLSLLLRFSMILLKSRSRGNRRLAHCLFAWREVTCLFCICCGHWLCPIKTMKWQFAGSPRAVCWFSVLLARLRMRWGHTAAAAASCNGLQWENRMLAHLFRTTRAHSLSALTLNP